MRLSLARNFHSESEWICSGCRSKLGKRSFHHGSVSRGKRRSISNTGLDERKINYNDPGQTRRLSASAPFKAASTRKARVPDGPARTRFAPSPTGYLHIGGLRTALFSYLLAKRTGGQFILRIEDTDQKRLVDDAEAKLCEDLSWAGLRWDEGPDVNGPHRPYKQSLRNDIYRHHALELLKAGQAYRCFCMPQTAGEAKAAYVTSGCYQNCSSLPVEQVEEKAADSSQHFTIRLRQPADAHKRVYPDLIYGNIQRLKRSPSAPLAASEDDTALDASDTILVKSDGAPTYHFANVVDDHLMGITHVIRGSEWMASTPLHYDIYTAFNWTPPQFAHVGLLVDQNKAKLSKRNADLALDVASMRDKHGVLPAPLINFLALLGWSNPTNNDVMELDDLVRNFDLKFTRGNAMVRMEKLWFLQKAHVARQCQRASETGDTQPVQPLVDQIVPAIKKACPEPLVNRNLSPADTSDDTALSNYTTAILLANSKSFQTPTQFIERNRYFFAFNPEQVPAEQEYYDKAQTLTAEDLREIVLLLFSQDLDHVESASPKTNNATPHASSTAPPPYPVTFERQVHDALSLEIWGATLSLLHFKDATLKASYEACRNAIEQLPVFLGDRSSTPESIAHQLARSLGTDTDVQALVQKYRSVNGALMKYLREKLSYGLPGPHISAVIAILGREECARRLRIEGDDDWSGRT